VKSAEKACWFKERSLLDTMKVIPLSEAKAHLSRYARLCHEEPIIVTVNGVPSFQLAPLEEEDDLIDRLLKYNPKFRQHLEARLNEGAISAREAARRL
jgi:prevent-host-death family protein